MFEYEVFEDFKDLVANAPKRPRSLIDDNPRGAKTAWWPSQLTSCRRRLVYDMVDGSDWDPSLNDEFTFAMGAAFEEVMGKKFKESKIYLGEEEGFSYQDERLAYPFRGRVDFIVELPGVDFMVPVELKTTASSQWDDKEYGPMKFYGSSSKPKTYNVAQLNLYMHKMDVPWGILCYLNKDTSEWQVYKVMRSEELQEAVVQHHIKAEAELEIKREDPDYIPPAVYLDDDGDEFEIKDVAITTYKVTRKGQFTAGDVKKDKYDKPNGKIGFPCIWPNKTGGWSSCDYFFRCWEGKLEELDLTEEDFK